MSMIGRSKPNRRSRPPGVALIRLRAGLWVCWLALGVGIPVLGDAAELEQSQERAQGCEEQEFAGRYVKRYEGLSLEDLMRVDVSFTADEAEEEGDGGGGKTPPPEKKYVEKYENLSLEDLMKVDVTSVAGVGQEWFKSPAAVYVITPEELRRSGHRSIPEALRMVPGLYVAQTDANTWTIGSRGFNGGLNNKLLVLIDGRTTYDYLFSGTFWDVQDIMLEDLDRIEVIRGPGATLWGANAVNGVINVTTKSAKETQGTLVTGGIGTEERGFGGVRYGGQVSENSWFRVWGQHHNHDSLVTPNGKDAHDDWDMSRGGFRFDTEGDDDLLFTVQGDIYNSDRLGQVSSGQFSDGRASGGNLLFRVSQEHESDGWSFQGYYDRTERVTGGLEVDRDTGDLDFRHHFKWGNIHETVWGLGYTNTSDRTGPVSLPGGGQFGYAPSARSQDIFSGFVQHTVTLAPDRLFAMVGTKLEDNDTSGFEFQPSGRIWWTPNDDHTFWAAISRPVRTPSRTDEDIFVNFPPFLTFKGSPETKSEELLAYEFGHRVMVTPELSLDTAVFFNDYRNLLSNAGTPVNRTFANGGEAESYGVEVAAVWQAAPNWKLMGSYSFLRVEEERPLGVAVDAPEGGTPKHMAQLRSMLDISKDIEFNSAIYYYDQVPRQNTDGFVRLDLGVTWHVNDRLDLALWGQNLCDESHREFNGTSEVQRAVYLQATFRF